MIFCANITPQSIGWNIVRKFRFYLSRKRIQTLKLYYKHEENLGNFLVLCKTQLTGGILLKMLKYLEVMLYIFEYPHVQEIVESRLTYAGKLS